MARSGETFEAAGVADRVTTVGQSFFDPLPAGADLYLLRGILDDWPNPEATAILGRCAEADRRVPSGDGRVAVLGGAVPDRAARPLTIERASGRVDEWMNGGEEESSILPFFHSSILPCARRAGLEMLAAGRQRSGYFVVECRPA